MLCSVVSVKIYNFYFLYKEGLRWFVLGCCSSSVFTIALVTVGSMGSMLPVVLRTQLQKAHFGLYLIYLVGNTPFTIIPCMCYIKPLLALLLYVLCLACMSDVILPAL